MNREQEKKAIENIFAISARSRIYDQLRLLDGSLYQRNVRKLLREYTVHLEAVYMLPIEKRECYFACSFEIYKFLRGMKMTKSTKGFREDVKEFLRETLED